MNSVRRPRAWQDSGVRFEPGRRVGAAEIERTWAGLRPASADGLPYLGAVPGLENAFVAAGHFRSGLQLSTGTAAIMAQLIQGEQPEIDLDLFRLDRDSRPRDEPIAGGRAARPAPLH